MGYRTVIPMFDDGREIGYLLWNGEAMEARFVEGELIGRYPTRHLAASALWAAAADKRWKINNAAATSLPFSGSSQP